MSSNSTDVGWYVNTVSGISSEALNSLNDFMGKNPNLPAPFQAVIAKTHEDWTQAQQKLDEAKKIMKESGSWKHRWVDWVVGGLIGAVIALTLTWILGVLH